MEPQEPRWHFDRQSPGAPQRAAMEGIFFAGQDGGESGSGGVDPIDTLVREVIQNSIDASDPAASDAVRVRLAIGEANGAPAWLVDAVDGHYGLRPHLRAQEGLDADAVLDESCRWLCYEDFNTVGLTGDPALQQEPEQKGEHFYWFFWNVGKSGKTGTDLGRWGLGKTVLPASSRINTMFVLTRRADGRNLLMGRSVLKHHRVGEISHVPDGYYHRGEKDNDRPMPIENDEIIDNFRRSFGVTRRDEPGLSVVVPFVAEHVEADELLRSVLLHWFWQVLDGRLVVEVVAPDGQEWRVDADTIGQLAGNVKWDGPKTKRKHRPPPLELAAWAVGQRREDMPYELDMTGFDDSPSWTNADSRFAVGDLEKLRQQYAAGEKVAVRVPLQIKYAEGEPQDAHFDVFLHRPMVPQDTDAVEGEDDYIRAGMTICGMRKFGSLPGRRALVVVDDPPLSQLLGDTEGPAHTVWKQRNLDRPESVRRYKAWQPRVRFVVDAGEALVKVLEPRPQGRVRDLLADVFRNPTPSDGRPRPGDSTDYTAGETTDVDIDRPTEAPRWWRQSKVSGGFRLRASGDPPMPGAAVLEVDVAYDLASGNPLKQYHPHDFQLDNGTVEISSRNADCEAIVGNCLRVRPRSPEFDVKVTGFDRRTDLYLEIRAVEPEADAVQGGAS